MTRAGEAGTRHRQAGRTGPVPGLDAPAPWLIIKKPRDAGRADLSPDPIRSAICWVGPDWWSSGSAS